MSYYCNTCKKNITKGEYKYSTQQFNKPLCRHHQNKVRNNNGQKESDAGDIAKKIMQGIQSVYKEGGVGLVLIALGGVAFLFLILMRSILDVVTFIISIIVLIGLIGTGVWILLKEKEII